MPIGWAGGHDIPEAKVRERYIRSRENLLRILPHLAELGAPMAVPEAAEA